MKMFIKQAMLAAVAFFSVQSYALTFDLPANGATLVGDVKTSPALLGDTLVNVARRYDLGYVELIEANPGIKPSASLSPEQKLVLPTEFILPDAPHRGMVINLSELRMYFYPPNTRQVMTFAVGIGREGGWDSPLGQMYIVRKKVDPTWTPTQHILESRLKDGVVLPKVVHPGPENPLGPYAFYTSVPAILIHGSNDASGIGRRSSSGCIRMQPEAIESFFDEVAIRSSVMIVEQPVKVGWRDNDLYIEVHVPLENNAGGSNHDLQSEAHRLIDRATAVRLATVNWSAVDDAVKEQHGYPVKIGVGIGAVPILEVPLNAATLVDPKSASPKKAKLPNTKHHHKSLFHGALL